MSEAAECGFNYLRVCAANRSRLGGLPPIDHHGVPYYDTFGRYSLERAAGPDGLAL